jgi:hypothetical protein
VTTRADVALQAGDARAASVASVTFVPKQVAETEMPPADFPGIVRELGDLGSGAIITEAGLARLLHRHPASIKRAVERGELPHPTRLLGGPVWTAGSIVRHLEARLAEAAKEAERMARRIAAVTP